MRGLGRRHMLKVLVLRGSRGHLVGGLKLIHLLGLLAMGGLHGRLFQESPMLQHHLTRSTLLNVDLTIRTLYSVVCDEGLWGPRVPRVFHDYLLPRRPCLHARALHVHLLGGKVHLGRLEGVLCVKGSLVVSLHVNLHDPRMAWVAWVARGQGVVLGLLLGWGQVGV